MVNGYVKMTKNYTNFKSKATEPSVIPAKASSIHPSKSRKMEHSIAVSLSGKIDSEREIVSEAEDFVNLKDHYQNKSKGYNKIEKASNLIRSLNVSTKKAGNQ